jgi:uncharacterized protein YegP (UPF0339 family)
MRTLILYKDRKKQWRWKLVAANGNKIANGGEGYINRIDCLDMAISIIQEPYNFIDGLKKST